MARDKFVNPATGEEYTWDTSHETEGEMALGRNIQSVATTGGHSRVYHQTLAEPLTLTWQGKFEQRGQLQQFYRWWALSDSQTFYLYDFDGQGYEVQITSFKPTRQRKLSYTGRDPSAPHHYWSYEITFMVYAFIAGDAADAGVEP